MTPEQRTVLDHVRWEYQYRPISWIATACGLTRRDVEQAVQALRLAGEPLISDGSGIRYSTDPAEVAACADALRRRFIHQALTARALRRTARRMESAAELTLELV